MATSNQVTFRTNRDAVIAGALRLCSAYDWESGQLPTASQITMGAEALNLLVKTLSSRGLQLWIRRYGVVFPQKNQAVFALGTPASGGDHSTLTTPLGVGGFLSTTTTTSKLAGATTLDLTAITTSGTAGVPVFTASNTFNIGVELSTGYIQWTTISGAPVGLVVTLANALTADVNAGAQVYVYQTKLSRPLEVLDGFVRQTGAYDTPVNLIPRTNYNLFGSKQTSFGVPTQIMYDRQTNVGYLYVYPAFISVNQLLYIEFNKQLDDLVTATDDYDMPQEWGEYLKYRLALSLAPEYEVPDNKFKQIGALAEATFSMVDSGDQENASLFIQPNGTMV